MRKFTRMVQSSTKMGVEVFGTISFKLLILMNSKFESIFSCGEARGLGLSPSALSFICWERGGAPYTKFCQGEFDGYPSSVVANLSATSINASCVCVLRFLWVKAAEFSQEN